MLAVIVAVHLSILGFNATAYALVDPFNPDFFMTDEEFNDASALSCDQIQAFLNERKGILKSYVDEGKAAALRADAGR